jgi:hypothetical protein
MPFEDDVALQGDVEIVRVLVNTSWCAGKSDGVERPSSAAFVDSSNEASCFILAETDLKLIATRFPGKKLGVVTVASARDAGFVVARDPEGGAGVPGHVVLVQRRARLESKQHVRLARQLANSGRVEPLPEIPDSTVPDAAS